MVTDQLPVGWVWGKLGDIASPQGRSIVSGPFGSNIGSRFFVDHGVPVIRGNNLTTDMSRFVDDGFVFITDQKAKELGNVDAIHDDLIFTAAGSLGQVGIIPNNSRYPIYVISNKQMRARLNKTLVDPIFAFYWFSSSRMVTYIQQRNTGSSVPLINLSVLRSLPIPLPPLPEQRAIAAVLGALDDKIELNRRMNGTLEAMARALFRSWFVDFDPVRAKMDGRPTGLPAEIEALFPEGMEDGRPRGWGVGRLDDILVLQRGFDLPTLTRTPGHYPVIAASGPNGTHDEYMVKGPGVTTGRSGVLGNVFFVHEDFWPLNTSLWVREFKESTPTHAYFLLQTLDFGIFNAGSAVPTLNRNHVHNLPMLRPPIDVVNAFDKIVMPLLSRQKVGREESLRLANIRDALLPKLMSGEVRVSLTEETAADAL